MKAKPSTKLRSLALKALVEEGSIFPKYNLDDISAQISIPRKGRIIVTFWNSSEVIHERNKHYKRLLKLTQK
jgi:hypothetical protein